MQNLSALAGYCLLDIYKVASNRKNGLSKGGMLNLRLFGNRPPPPSLNTHTSHTPKVYFDTPLIKD